METRTLGRSGLKVTTFCLGGNVFGWSCDQERSEAVLDAYIDAGGNFIDTADSYSTWVSGNVGGESETIIGEWMRKRGNRAGLIIATKVGSKVGNRPNDRGLSRHHITASVAGSLRRLQTDYIDLYQAHYDDAATPLDETMRAFDDLVCAGKVRYIGASNFRPWRIARALGIADRYGWQRYVSEQPPYNLVQREPFERDMERLCAEEGLGVITYSSMADGFLSGKYRPGAPLPASDRAEDVREQYMNDRGWAILAAVDAVAGQHNATPAQVAMAWIVGRPGIAAAIAGATTREQVGELAAGVALALDGPARETLDAASAWKE